MRQYSINPNKNNQSKIIITYKFQFAFGFWEIGLTKAFQFLHQKPLFLQNMNFNKNKIEKTSHPRLAKSGSFVLRDIKIRVNIYFVVVCYQVQLS